jgi:hypothetical protein
MKLSNLVISALVISNLAVLSGTETSRSQVSVESKDLYSVLRIKRDFLCGEVRP